MEILSPTNCIPDDIQYLLHLESLKRYTDESKNVQRQVEEHARNYIDAKREYQEEFERLVNLTKEIKLSVALDSKDTHIDDTHVSHTIAQLADMTKKISSDKRPTDLEMRTLDECKLQLQRNHRPRCKLTKQQLNFASNREALNGLRTMLDSVENGFEMSTLAAMDQFTIELQLPPMWTPENIAPQSN